MELLNYKVLMHRTLANLDFIKARDGNEPASSGKSPAQKDEPPYAVTQRVNSFLGAFAHVYDQTLKMEYVQVGGSHAFNPVRALPPNWPRFEPSPTISPSCHLPSDFGEQCRRVRNALAHGSIKFEASGKEVVAIHLWTNSQQGRGPIDWAGKLTVAQFENFLRVFCKAIDAVFDDSGNAIPTPTAGKS